MARINFDDDVETQEEFWNLLRLVSGDRDSALGKLVRFFRLAQKRFGHGEAITEGELEQHGLRCMIESGWAVPIDGGFRSKGAAKYFAWYVQKIDAGKRGGFTHDARTKKAARDAVKRAVDSGELIKPNRCQRCEKEIHLEGHHEDYSRPLEVIWLCILCHEMRHHRPDEFANRPIAAESRNQSTDNPLAPSPAPVQKQENIYMGAAGVKPEEHARAIAQYQKTLDHFKTGREPLQSEKEELWKMLKNCIPVEELCHALSGLRYRPATPSYDPAKDVNLYKLWDREKRAKLVSLSTQEAKRRADKKAGAA